VAEGVCGPPDAHKELHLHYEVPEVCLSVCLSVCHCHARTSVINRTAAFSYILVAHAVIITGGPGPRVTFSILLLYPILSPTFLPFPSIWPFVPPVHLLSTPSFSIAVCSYVGKLRLCGKFLYPHVSEFQRVLNRLTTESTACHVS